MHGLIGPYLLDAVDDLERAAFDRHLRACDACRTDVDDLRETAARLADGAWSVPSPRLRDNVLATIARTRQVPPRAAVVSARPGLHRWRITAAAAVVVAALGAGSATYVVQDQRVRHERAIAEAALAKEDRVRSVLTAPDRVVRTGTVRGGGRVTVVSSRLLDAGVIVLAADAAPADGKIFQLWKILPGPRMVPAGSLDPGQSVIVQVVDGLPDASAVGVTVEPPQGSLVPTGPSAATVEL
jgi:anti-sigma factor RsiW